MILEGIVVSVVALFVGAGVMKILLMFEKIEKKVDRSDRKKYETMKDPELLLKRLNENGSMVDDGDEISFSVEEHDGKKQLVQKITKNTVAKGIPENKKSTNKGKRKKDGKGKGKKQ